jgi:hypothetical protein
MSKILSLLFILPLSLFSSQVGTNFLSLGVGFADEDLKINGVAISGDLTSYNLGFNHNLYLLEDKYGLDVGGSLGIVEGDILNVDIESFGYSVGISPFLKVDDTSFYVFANYLWSETDYINTTTSAKTTIDNDSFIGGFGFQSVLNKLIFGASLSFPEDATNLGGSISYKIAEDYTIGVGFGLYDSDPKTGNDGTIFETESRYFGLGLTYSL